jgi:cAMP phosphodiesterase
MKSFKLNSLSVSSGVKKFHIFIILASSDEENKEQLVEELGEHIKDDIEAF